MKKLLSLMALSMLFVYACDNKGTTNTPSTPASSSAPVASANPSSPAPVVSDKVDFASVKTVVAERCAACHAPKGQRTIMPDQGPAGGVLLITPEEIKAKAARIKARALESKTMPTNNATKITEDERALLGKWVDAGANIN